MPRAGYLILLALLLAAAAAGVLVWTNHIETGLFGPKPLADRLAENMASIASEGGFAATFNDADARRWKLADGHKFERLAVDPARSAIGRLSSSVPVDATPPSWESQGLSIELPVSFAQRANGRRVEIGIIARAAQSNPSSVLSAVFATRQSGNSGWRNFKLGSELQIHTMLFDMPEVATGYTANPIIVVHSDAAGKGRAVELLGAYAKLVPAPGPQ